MSDLSEQSENFVLLPEVRVRQTLGTRAQRLRVLAPYGAWVGCGALRVLRVKDVEDGVEVVAGYESYERLGASA